MESLLGQQGGERETVRDGHPDDSWRADALGSSRHARLTDHIREPLDDRDPDRAARICAVACRNLLRDFAPAVLLLPGAERSRCRALTVFALTLFDFASQPGVEGERLAALNRIEFTLEEALSGAGVGQPTFVRLAVEESLRPWPREAFDEIVRLARRRIVEPRLETAAEIVAESEALARAIATALGPSDPDDEVVRLGAAALRLRGVLDLGEALRHHRPRLPLAELPPAGDPGSPLDRQTVDRAVRQEIHRVRAAIVSARRLSAASPRPHRRALRFLRLASLELAARVDDLGWRVVATPPRLGATKRVNLLLRARLGLG